MIGCYVSQDLIISYHHLYLMISYPHLSHLSYDHTLISHSHTHTHLLISHTSRMTISHAFFAISHNTPIITSHSHTHTHLTLTHTHSLSLALPHTHSLSLLLSLPHSFLSHAPYLSHTPYLSHEPYQVTPCVISRTVPSDAMCHQALLLWHAHTHTLSLTHTHTLSLFIHPLTLFSTMYYCSHHLAPTQIVMNNTLISSLYSTIHSSHLCETLLYSNTCHLKCVVNSFHLSIPQYTHRISVRHSSTVIHVISSVL